MSSTSCFVEEGLAYRNFGKLDSDVPEEEGGAGLGVIRLCDAWPRPVLLRPGLSPAFAQMLKRMMEFKGPLPQRMIKSHIRAFETMGGGQTHFTDGGQFMQQEPDPVTGESQGCMWNRSGVIHAVLLCWVADEPTGGEVS